MCKIYFKKLFYSFILLLLTRKNYKPMLVKEVVEEFDIGILHGKEIKIINTREVDTFEWEFTEQYRFPKLALQLLIKLNDPKINNQEFLERSICSR